MFPSLSRQAQSSGTCLQLHFLGENGPKRRAEARLAKGGRPTCAWPDLHRGARSPQQPEAERPNDRKRTARRGAGSDHPGEGIRNSRLTGSWRQEPPARKGLSGAGAGPAQARLAGWRAACLDGRIRLPLVEPPHGRRDHADKSGLFEEASKHTQSERIVAFRLGMLYAVQMKGNLHGSGICKSPV
jgi:hypothetical protein